MSDSLAPGFMIAVPQLLDPNFRQTVVLLLELSDEGGLGLVVNRESPLLLKDLCRDHEIGYQGDPAKRVRSGGPVQPGQGLVLFCGEDRDPAAGREVAEGLHVSASKETLRGLCSQPGGRFHCYAGYAGWGPGQMEREIKEGSWIVAPVNPILVLDSDPQQIWLKGMQSVGIDPAALVPGSVEEA